MIPLFNLIKVIKIFHHLNKISSFNSHKLIKAFKNQTIIFKKFHKNQNSIFKKLHNNNKSKMRISRKFK